MLKELAPSQYNIGIRLFGWDEILEKRNNRKYKAELIKKFNRTFGLEWEMVEEGGEFADLRNNEFIVFDKVDDDTVIIEHKNAEEIIVIELPKGRMMLEDVHMSVRSIKRNENYSLAGLELKKKYSGITFKIGREGKLTIYTIKHDPTASVRTRFLDVTLSKEAKNELSKIERREDRNADLIESCPEYKDIRNNKKNWRYSLNFYGFLLYLACEYEAERKDVRRIYAVISNASILSMAQFLLYWKDFKDNIHGFKVGEILLQIGNEFKNQLDYDIITEDKNYLLKRVTDRYFAELYRWCYYNFGMGFISRWYANNKILQGKDTIFKKLVEYRIYILQDQRKWLTEEINNIDILLSPKEGSRIL
jgi:hypothetical protein